MGKKYLIDTNVISKFLEETLPKKAMNWVGELIDNGTNISIINKIELLSYEPPKEQMDAIRELIDNVFIYPLDNIIAEKAAEIRRKHTIKLPDSVIAATALVHDLTIITINETDFSKIPHVSYINPSKRFDT
ncbi:MAG: type II toxin-antitoxin system VapC family toxin [Spirosomaceae bacterium]|jgi:hypothetical protein|nr:type II toxin-antitoxin system VapC family toxin [Spirosomataceae bacterium]